VALGDLTPLNEGVSQALVDDELRQGDEHRRQRDQPEIRRREQAGKDDEDD
jgi:hypothetical protein